MEKKYRMTFFFMIGTGERNVVSKELNEFEKDSIVKLVELSCQGDVITIPCDGYTCGVNWSNCVCYALAEVNEAPAQPVPEVQAEVQPEEQVA